MTVDGWVSLVALGVACYAGWRIMPRPIVLDWNALFLTTLGGLRDRAAPVSSDPSLDPQPVLGVGWGEVVGWSEPLVTALQRRLGSIVWVGVGTPEARRAADLIGGRVVEVDSLDEPDRSDRIATLTQALAEKYERFVVVVDGVRAQGVLEALHGDEVLRDHVRAVVLLGPDMATLLPWVATHFDHDQLDTELNVPISYIVLHGQQGAPLPQPPRPKSGARAIDSVNLGPAPSGTDPADVVRALLILLANKARGW